MESEVKFYLKSSRHFYRTVQSQPEFLVDLQLSQLDSTSCNVTRACVLVLWEMSLRKDYIIIVLSSSRIILFASLSSRRLKKVFSGCQFQLLRSKTFFFYVNNDTLWITFWIVTEVVVITSNYLYQNRFLKNHLFQNVVYQQKRLP